MGRIRYSTIKILKIKTSKLHVLNRNCSIQWYYNAVMHLKHGIGMANSADPDQTAPLGAV